MALDVSAIGNALMQKQPSVLDYAEQYAAADDRALNRQKNALLMQQAQADMQDKIRVRGEQDGIRNALMGMKPGSSMEDRIGAIEGLGTPTALSQADALRKTMLEQQKAQAGIGKDNAEADSKKFATYKARLEHGMQSVIGASNPELARQAIMQGVQAGHFDQATADRELQNIPNDPQQYSQWRMQKLGMMLNAKDQLEQDWKQREFALKANNELIGPDGKPNTQLAGLKMGLARAGAANVSVNTEKSYAGHVAEGLAKNDVAALDAARTAPDRVNTARSIKQILDNDKVITGTGAEARLAITKALSTAGIIDGGSTTATEDLVSMLNSQTLDAIKSSGLGSGQGFTDKDRQFLQDAKSGRIEINKATLRRMADLNERAGLATITYGNKIASRLKGNPAMGNVGQDLEVTPPDGDALSKAIAAEAQRRAAAGGRK